MVKCLNEFKSTRYISHIIHGCGGMTDEAAGKWANANGVSEVRVRAQWHYYGDEAGPIRNQRMMELHPDLVLAFPGGRGTQSTVSIARREGINVLLWEPASEASAG